MQIEESEEGNGASRHTKRLQRVLELKHSASPVCGAAHREWRMDFHLWLYPFFYFFFLFTDCFCAVWLKTASFGGWETETAAVLTRRLPARSASERGVLINTLGAMERERYASLPPPPPPPPPPSFYSISTFIHLSSPPLTSAWLSVFPHINHGSRRREVHAQHSAELQSSSTHSWTHMSHVHRICIEQPAN